MSHAQLKLASLAVVALAALALVACGDDEPSGSEAAEAVTPAQGLAEIELVRAGLGEALDAYREGNPERASELAATAYLEHFEIVEIPLEEADHELNEELEELIREELRAAIDDGAPAKRVAALVAEAEAGLGQAARLLEAETS